MSSEYLPPILRRVKALGFKVFTNGDYDLNIVGIRSRARLADNFDDEIVVVWKELGIWRSMAAQATTDPGGYWLKNGERATAILCPGQYRSVFKISTHAGKYTALCQRAGPVKVWRDGNKDLMLDHDPGSIESGYFGINIHRASIDRGEDLQGASKIVGRYSAGCQVFKDPGAFSELMRLAHLQRDKRGWDTFTYTLIED